MPAKKHQRKQVKLPPSTSAGTRQVAEPSEQIDLTLRFRDDSLPLPVGFASDCAIVQRGRDYEIVLWDSASRKCLARLLVGQVPLFEHLLGTSLDFYAGTVAWMAERRIEPAAIPSELPHLDDISIPLAANVFRLFRAGTESVLECYYISPRVIHLYRTSPKREPVKPYPVCQIQMDVSLLVGLLARVKELKESSPPSPLS